MLEEEEQEEEEEEEEEEGESLIKGLIERRITCLVTTRYNSLYQRALCSPSPPRPSPPPPLTSPILTCVPYPRQCSSNMRRIASVNLPRSSSLAHVCVWFTASG